MTRFSRILSLYIAWQFLTSFFALLAGIAGLILMFDTIELLRRTAGNAALGFSTVFGLALLKLPHTTQATLPFVIMLAMMFTLFRLSRSHELMVIRSVGISVWQFLTPPLISTMMLGIINLTVVDPFAASLYDTYQRLEAELIRRSATNMDISKAGLWLREVQGNVVTMIHAAQVRQKDDALLLNSVSVFRTENEKLKSRFEGATGRLAGGHLNLEDVWEIELQNGKTVTHHDAFRLPTTITVEQVQDSLAAPETMSFWELPDFIRASQAAGFAARPHRLYWQSLLASPFLLCAMVLVASSFYLTVNTRIPGWTMRGAAGIGTGFVLYFFNHFTYALGMSATLPLELAAWAPTTATTMIGLAYLFHREDG